MNKMTNVLWVKGFPFLFLFYQLQEAISRSKVNILYYRFVIFRLFFLFWKPLGTLKCKSNKKSFPIAVNGGAWCQSKIRSECQEKNLRRFLVFLVHYKKKPRLYMYVISLLLIWAKIYWNFMRMRNIEFKVKEIKHIRVYFFYNLDWMCFLFYGFLIRLTARYRHFFSGKSFSLTRLWWYRISNRLYLCIKEYIW